MRSFTSCPRTSLSRAFQDPDTGRLYPMPCGSWSCPTCGPANAHRLGVLAAAAEPERFVTLTRAGADLRTAYRGLQTLSQGLRRAGYGWEYLGVPERHRNGFWHLHLLQKGDYIPQRVLSARAASAGMGRVVDIRRVRGAQQVARYLVKYLTKELDAERPKHARRYRTSRGFWPGGRRVFEQQVWGAPRGWRVVGSRPGEAGPCS